MRTGQKQGGMYEEKWDHAGIADRASVLRHRVCARFLRRIVHGELFAWRTCGRKRNGARKHIVRGGGEDHPSRGACCRRRLGVHRLVGWVGDLRRGRKLYGRGGRHLHGNVERSFRARGDLHRYICARRACRTGRGGARRADRERRGEHYPSRSSRSGGRLGVRRLVGRHGNLRRGR